MKTNKIFTTNLNVRFRDLDAMGHVNNAVFFTYFEEIRKSFFEQVFQFSDPSDYNFILARISCDYRKPVKISDGLTIQMWVSKIGNKSFNIGYKVINFSDQTIVYATGESVQVWFDYSRNKTISIGEDQKERFLEYLL